MPARSFYLRFYNPDHKRCWNQFKGYLAAQRESRVTNDDLLGELFALGQDIIRGQRSAKQVAVKIPPNATVKRSR